MTREPILIDDHLVVACPVAEVSRRLSDHSKIAAWFSGTVESTSTVITTAAGQRLAVENVRERWMHNDQMLTIDGLLGDVWLHAHLTVFGVVPSVIGAHVDVATEIWVHIELSNGPATQQVATVIRAVIAQGLERLSIEMGGPHRPPS